MGGFFGTVSQRACVTDLFYGTDYNSHLGTKRGGLATYSKEQGFIRSIHNLESSYFRTKFESDLDKFNHQRHRRTTYRYQFSSRALRHRYSRKNRQPSRIRRRTTLQKYAFR